MIHFNQIEELKAQVVHLKKENSQLVEEHMRFVEDIRKIRLVTDESLTIAQKELVKVKEVYSGLQR